VADPVEEAAREAQANAHAPYSGFRVGAALLAEDGRIFVGANVENASYGLTNCAERVALGAAVTSGARTFVRMVVVTDATPPAAPCGACRQVLSEFSRDLAVESVGPDGSRSWVLADLLPDDFGPEDLIR
jgi:cytidine deaminase